MIKGDNQDLRHVEKNLRLPFAVKGYPFVLSWDSGNKDKIDVTQEVSIPFDDSLFVLHLTGHFPGNEKTAYWWEGGWIMT